LPVYQVVPKLTLRQPRDLRRPELYRVPAVRCVPTA